MKNYVRIAGIVLIAIFVYTVPAECQIISEAQNVEVGFGELSRKSGNYATLFPGKEQLRNTSESNSSLGILLVELLTFDAKVKDRNVELSWSTLFEKNNDFFTIEKSIDGQQWELVENLKGAGNSGVLIHYSSTDERPYLGVSYYRLTQTDFNGEKKQIGIEAVNFVLEEAISVYPNPTDGKLSIVTDKFDIEEIGLYNFNNQDMLNEAIVLSMDGHFIALDLTALPTGIYYVKIGSVMKKIQKL